MSTRNLNQRAPGSELPERDTQVYEFIRAQPAPRREGPRISEERVAVQAFGSFYSAVASADRDRSNVYEVQPAGQFGRHEPGVSNPTPSWDNIPPEALAQFAGGMDYGDPGTPGAPVLPTRRPGAWNTNTISPLAGLARGERQGTHVVAKTAPEEGGRGRRNNADVTGRW
jgi:hypothetical protein